MTPDHLVAVARGFATMHAIVGRIDARVGGRRRRGTGTCGGSCLGGTVADLDVIRYCPARRSGQRELAD